MQASRRCRISDVRGSKAGTYPARMYIDIELVPESDFDRSRSEIASMTSTSTALEKGNHVVAAVTKKTRPQYLSFRNFYVAWITIKARVPKVDNGWVTLVERHGLMRDVHYEMDATDSHTIDLAAGAAWVRRHQHEKEAEHQEVNGNTTKEGEHDTVHEEKDNESSGNASGESVAALTALRIYMYQPSPRWSNTAYTLTDIQLFDSLPVVSVGEKEQRGASGLSNASTPGRRSASVNGGEVPLLIPVTSDHFY